MTSVSFLGASSRLGVGNDDPQDVFETKGVTAGGRGIQIGKIFPGWNSIYLNGLNGNGDYNILGRNSNASANGRTIFNRPNGHEMHFRMNNVTQMHLDTSNNLNVVGAVSKGSGTFDIQHPVLSDKRLLHSFIEGPRIDLLYRGQKQLVAGHCTIDLETEICGNGATMSAGTFEALGRNPNVFLQNVDSFDRVIGVVSGKTLEISCQNASSTDRINWIVMVERNDEFVKEGWERTNDDGYMVLERDNDPPLPSMDD